MEEQDEQVQVTGYKITKTLGKGTFGKVRIATHIATQEKVAVKILEKQLIKDPSDVERISREIKILKKVYHPFIITLYQIVQTQNRLYLFMQYANEGDLFGKICSERKLKQPVAARYFLQLLWGLKYLHQQGITHRDLKPENLLLENDQIKIADFGLGNFFQSNIQLKTACGSPCYAAPEMISKLPYDPPKVDAWSSGIVLYAMIVGYLPFEDSNVHSLYTKIKKGQFKIPEWVSPLLKQLLRGILTVDPQKRLSIDQIINHPWLKFHYSNLQIVPTIKIDPQHIVTVAAQFKLDKDKLNKSLATKKHNSLTTTYYLWLKKDARQKSDASKLVQMKQEQTSINDTSDAIKSPVKQKVYKQLVSTQTTTTTVENSTAQKTQSKQNGINNINNSNNINHIIVQSKQIKQKVQQSKVQKYDPIKEETKSPQNNINDHSNKSKIDEKESKKHQIFIQEQIKVEFQITKKKQLDKTPLRKAGRMETQGMKKTAQRLYERSGSRETQVSVRLTAAKKNKLLLKRIQKKPRLFNSSFFFQGHVQQLRDFVKKVQPKNQNISVQYYQVSPNVFYIVKTNMDIANLKNQLIQRFSKQ